MATNSGFGVPSTLFDPGYESDPDNLLSPLDSPLSDSYLAPFSTEECAASLGLTMEEYYQEWVNQIDLMDQLNQSQPHPYDSIVWNLDDSEDWDWEIMSGEWAEEWVQYFAPPTSPAPAPRRTYADVVRYGPLR